MLEMPRKYETLCQKLCLKIEDENFDRTSQNLKLSTLKTTFFIFVTQICN